MGKNKDPGPGRSWTWVSTTMAQGFVGLHGLALYVKGDGKKYRVRLGRVAVEDYCDFEFTFVAPKEWTLITAPLDKFMQPSGASSGPRLQGREQNRFPGPGPGNDEDFELRFTEVEFITEAPAKKK